MSCGLRGTISTSEKPVSFLWLYSGSFEPTEIATTDSSNKRTEGWWGDWWQKLGSWRLELWIYWYMLPPIKLTNSSPKKVGIFSIGNTSEPTIDFQGTFVHFRCIWWLSFNPPTLVASWCLQLHQLHQLQKIQEELKAMFDAMDDNKDGWLGEMNQKNWKKRQISLKLTAFAPENRWDWKTRPFPFGIRPIFRCDLMLVLGSVTPVKLPRSFRPFRMECAKNFHQPRRAVHLRFVKQKQKPCFVVFRVYVWDEILPSYIGMMS